MPKAPAALRASSWSFTHGHIVLSLKKLGSDQFFINTPVTSYPCSFNSAAATELSTPPDIATNTLGLRVVFNCLCLFQILAIFVSFTGPKVAPALKVSGKSIIYFADRCFITDYSTFFALG